MSYNTYNELDETTKLQNVLAKLQSREDRPSYQGPKAYYDRTGTLFTTTQRVMSNVPPPITTYLTDKELFSYHNFAPNYNLLRDHFKREGRLTESQVLRILEVSGRILSSETNILEIPSPVTVCGDIHGQFYDLVELFEVAGDPGQTSFLFLGDYVDRGMQSLECLLLLLSMKINHPTTFIMLRGNHESREMTTYFTFQNECIRKQSKKVYDASLACFAALPIAALVNKQMFCVHAGISKDLRTLADIDKIDRFAIDFPHRGLYCDLMWSDPLENYDSDNSPAEYSINRDRGCSYMYNYHAVCEFLKRNNLLCVVRAHQPQESGYRFYKSTRQGFPSLITVFSAPNYCGSYGNKAAILEYDGRRLAVKQFKNQPQPYYLPLGHDVFSWSIPFAVERTLELLTGLLNVCTKDELEAVSSNYSSREPKADEQDFIKNKLMAIARVAGMLKKLKEDSNKFERLRNLNGSYSLPKGVLLHSSSFDLDETITSFEEARSVDLKYEGAPRY